MSPISLKAMFNSTHFKNDEQQTAFVRTSRYFVGLHGFEMDLKY